MTPPTEPGWVTVSREPVEQQLFAMYREGQSHPDGPIGVTWCRDIYRAGIEAAPPAPVEPSAAFALALAEKMPAMSMEWSDELREAWLECAAMIFRAARPPSPITQADIDWGAATAKTLFGEDGTEDGNDLAAVAPRAMVRAERAEAAVEPMRKALERLTKLFPTEDATAASACNYVRRIAEDALAATPEAYAALESKSVLRIIEGAIADSVSGDWEHARDAATAAILGLSPQRRPLSDEDVERAARARYEAAHEGYGPTSTNRWATWDEACEIDGWRERECANMRADLSTLPVAGGGEATQFDLSPATEAEKRRTRELVENGEIAIASGEVAGLIRQGRSWASPRNISRDMAAAKQLITRLVDALEGRL